MGVSVATVVSRCVLRVAQAICNVMQHDYIKWPTGEEAVKQVRCLYASPAGSANRRPTASDCCGRLAAGCRQQHARAHMHVPAVSCTAPPQTQAQAFSELGQGAHSGIPQVVGSIDGSHIPITKPACIRRRVHQPHGEYSNLLQVTS